MSSEFLLNIVVAIVFGAICAAIAQSRGRSALGWFFVGAILNCIGLILLLVLPNLKVQEEREERMRRENQRLRERLRKDRMVADQRHEETVGRLAVHDDALGLDTGRGSAGAIPAPSPSEHRPERVIDREDATEWYYLNGQDRIGPVTVSDMGGLWDDKRIDGETLVWCAAMADWAALKTVSKLKRMLDG
jgi:hypothetical protein